MKMNRCCHYCGQLLPEMRLGVRLTALKARIFDIVVRAGECGVSGEDLHAIVYQDEDKKPARESIKSHVVQINDLLEDTGYRIRSDKLSRKRRSGASMPEPFCYRLVKVS
jgi:hypothetical protein